MDLMLTACRQDSTMCGGVSAITTIATIAAAAATASVRTIGTTMVGATEKCTFVHTSLVGAPTFKIEKSSTAGANLAA